MEQIATLGTAIALPKPAAGESRGTLTVGVLADRSSVLGREVARGVATELAGRAGWSVYLADPARPPSVQRWLNCDRLVLACAYPAAMDPARVPADRLVCCGRAWVPAARGLVAWDDEAIGEMAAEYLIGQRYQHIAYAGLAQADVVEARRAGLLRVLNRHQRPLLPLRRDVVGLPTPPLSLTSLENIAGAEIVDRSIDSWLRWLPRGVGILADNDQHAWLLTQRCTRIGLPIPEAVGVLGVHNDDLVCTTVAPAISSIETAAARLGQLAMEMLYAEPAARLPAASSAEPGTAADGLRVVRVPPVRVAVRRSTDRLAVEDPELRKALKIIRERACEPLTADALFDAVTTPRRLLTRRFTEILGRGPHEEITQVRLERARELLAQPDISIDDVAVAVGFRQRQSFTRWFRDTTGELPSAYAARATGASNIPPTGCD